MTRRLQLLLVDETGQPLSPHIADALVSLVPRLLREFPLIRDQALLTDLIEEAGRRVVKREHRSGPIEHLHGYAWVTLRSVARSWVRRGSSRLALNTLTSDESTTTLHGLAATIGSAEQIERTILRRQVLALLTREERLVCTRRALGFSSREIATLTGTSAGAVDTLLSRTKTRLRKLFNLQHSDARQDEGINRVQLERRHAADHDASDEKVDEE